MQNTSLPSSTYGVDADAATTESAGSSVAWAAIIAGAMTMTAVTLVLMPLGSALGFAIAAPGHSIGEPLKAFTIAGGIWMVVVQWLSAALGGYLTGRLRAKWVGAHTHEIFFRDTVHGFLAWALSAVAAAVLVLSAIPHLMTGGPFDATALSYGDRDHAFLLSLSMLIGAFVASVGGALGGHDRDIHYHTGKFRE